VHDLPGMTRDVLEGEARLPDGRGYLLLDTGGYDPEGKEEMPAAVRDKAIRAIRQADLVLLVVDASTGIVAGDRATARAAREAGRQAVVVANKIDRKEGESGELEAWELGFGEVYGVSAEHGTGVDELVAAIAERMPPQEESPAAGETPREIAVAIVGRPNVGKSSVLNALLGLERTIVSETAGTTRDAIDATLLRNGRHFRLVDTAGIRRKAKTEKGPEVLSVVQARKRIADCDVALLVLDASQGPTSQDATVASYVEEEGKGLVLLANKWDVAGKAGEGTAETLREALEERVPFARHAPVLLISAVTGRGIARVLETAAEVAENRRRRITTGELNRVLGRELRDNWPRTASGKRLRVYYVAQTGSSPPTFTLVANRAERLHFSESRRIQNRIRRAADFEGSPIRISVRSRSRTSPSPRGRGRG
jgi:GTP-binding protein